jgi:hypothetical protein
MGGSGPADRATTKIRGEALRQAKVASAIRGCSLVDYVSESVLAAAAREIEEWRSKSPAPRPEGRRGEGPPGSPG